MKKLLAIIFLVSIFFAHAESEDVSYNVINIKLKNISSQPREVTVRCGEEKRKMKFEVQEEVQSLFIGNAETGCALTFWAVSQQGEAFYYEGDLEKDSGKIKKRISYGSGEREEIHFTYELYRSMTTQNEFFKVSPEEYQFED